jgi:hypothetical protein
MNLQEGWGVGEGGGEGRGGLPLLTDVSPQVCFSRPEIESGNKHEGNF